MDDRRDEQLLKHFPGKRAGKRFRQSYNEQPNNYTDEGREFLIVHHCAAARNENRHHRNARVRPHSRVINTVTADDHAVVGEVFAVSTSPGHPPGPLLYGLRSYWSLNRKNNTIGSADADDKRPLREEGSE
jgi:hypothetical protein